MELRTIRTEFPQNVWLGLVNAANEFNLPRGKFVGQLALLGLEQVRAHAEAGRPLPLAELAAAHFPRTPRVPA